MPNQVKCPNCDNSSRHADLYQCDDCNEICCDDCVAFDGPKSDGDYHCPFCDSENLTYIGEIC